MTIFKIKAIKYRAMDFHAFKLRICNSYFIFVLELYFEVAKNCLSVEQLQLKSYLGFKRMFKLKEIELLSTKGNQNVWQMYCCVAPMRSI